MKTYEIKSVVVIHPVLGAMNKKNIIYYDCVNDIGTAEFYKEGETEMRTGYTLKTN